VAHLRITKKTLMGNLIPGNQTDNKLSDADNPDPLNLAVRSQVNFIENVGLSGRVELKVGPVCPSIDCTGRIEWNS